MKLWDALTKPEFTRQWWHGMHQESDWQVGSAWRMMFPEDLLHHGRKVNGRICDAGEILAIDPPLRLVLKWRNEFRPDLKAEGYTRCAFEIVAHGEATELKVTHEIDRDGSKMIEAVSNAWPAVLSQLKSLLETGSALQIDVERASAADEAHAA
jgi:uncharacterized protein YndB with AHSA1/START domain